MPPKLQKFMNQNQLFSGMNDNYELSKFARATKYLPLEGVNQFTKVHLVSDGVNHLMQNGGSWLITDCILYQLHNRPLKGKRFLRCIFHKCSDNYAQDGQLQIQDENENILFEHQYDLSIIEDGTYCFYIVELDKFYVMLPSEYHG